MTEERKDTDSAAQAASEEDAKVIQDAILGEHSEPSEEKPGETEEKVEKKEEEKPKAEEEAKPKEEKKAGEKPAEAGEEEEAKKIEAILNRFQGTPEEKAKAVAKAYREFEKLHGKKDKELGDLRKEVLDFKNFQEDWKKDPKAVIDKLTELAKKTAGEEEESKEDLLKALQDPTGKELDKFIEDKISAKTEEKEEQKGFIEKEEKRMEGLYPGWSERAKQREALETAIRLGKFPYPQEILDMAVRGSADPDKILADAKDALKKEEMDALANKTDQNVQEQLGGPAEKKELSDSEVIEGEILTKEELERANQ